MSANSAANYALALCKLLTWQEVQRQFSDREQLVQLQSEVEAQKAAWYATDRKSKLEVNLLTNQCLLVARSHLCFDLLLLSFVC
jgi:hypothetical protein